VGGDAAGQSRLLVKVADAAEVAFALFTDIAEQDERAGEFDAGVKEGTGDGEQADDASAIVAGSGGFKPVAVDDGVERRIGWKNGVKVGREDDDRAGALGGQMGGGKKAEDIARGVGFNAGDAGLGKAGREPLGAGFFAKGRGGDGGEICLPVHDGFGIAVKPGEGGVDRAAGGECRDLGESRVAREDRHGVVSG